MALFKFTKNIFEGKVIELYNYGNNFRDYTYIDDVVEAMYKILNKEKKIKIINNSLIDSKSNIFNIGNGKKISTIALVNEIENILNKKANKKLLPKQKEEIINTLASSSKLKKYIKFNFKTDYKTGVKNFIDWYLKYNK